MESGKKLSSSSSFLKDDIVSCLLSRAGSLFVPIASVASLLFATSANVSADLLCEGGTELMLAMPPVDEEDQMPAVQQPPPVERLKTSREYLDWTGRLLADLHACEEVYQNTYFFSCGVHGTDQGRKMDDILRPIETRREKIYSYLGPLLAPLRDSLLSKREHFLTAYCQAKEGLKKHMLDMTKKLLSLATWVKHVAASINYKMPPLNKIGLLEFNASEVNHMLDLAETHAALFSPDPLGRVNQVLTCDSLSGRNESSLPPSSFIDGEWEIVGDEDDEPIGNVDIDALNDALEE